MLSLAELSQAGNDSNATHIHGGTTPQLMDRLYHRKVKLLLSNTLVWDTGREGILIGKGFICLANRHANDFARPWGPTIPSFSWGGMLTYKPFLLLSYSMEMGSLTKGARTMYTSQKCLTRITSRKNFKGFVHCNLDWKWIRTTFTIFNDTSYR